MTTEEKMMTLNQYIEEAVNKHNRCLNACVYNGDYKDELIIAFANKNPDSIQHYKQVVKMALCLDGIIKHTEPATYKTTIKFL